MSYEHVLRTELISGKPKSFEEKRKKRIQEALHWPSGTQEKPRKHIVSNESDEVETFFLKPGKEVFREKNPNPYDMTPFVGGSEKRLNFADLWTELSRISLVDFDIFKAVLTLIYRNAYMIDHVETESGQIRYLPNNEVLTCIKKMDKDIGNVLSEGLFNMLYFLDVLGWNEDVKYHTEKSLPCFGGRFEFNTGRVNTLLTCIRVPYQGALFVSHIIDKYKDKDEIDFMLLYSIMQQFAKSRGTCVPTHQNLLEWLSPYIVDNKEKSKKLF
jgi:hypothetical protein